MGKRLVIVESPSKAKTIQKYLGNDYVIASSYGHVRDLPKKDLGIDVKRHFTPKYEVSDDKKKVIAELRKLAKSAEEIYLATDEDREGEAISWHLCEALGLDPKEAKRISYTEVTKAAIERAIDNPRKINLDLVNAQQARRVLDRIVGYEVSPVLWKKVRPSLSAGRVQSVAVRLLVEREREIMEFEPSSSFKIKAEFAVETSEGQGVLQATSSKKKVDESQALQYLEEAKASDYFVNSIVKKPGKKRPSPPFTTSTLQQEAGRKLGFSVSRTMSVAQRLYEAGHITYMRTDSQSLAQVAIHNAQTTICNTYGDKYSNPRQFSTRNSSAQEAHEAIRPTNFGNTSINAEFDETRLYDLIYKRTIASQMADAELERTTMTIGLSQSELTLEAKAEMIVFDGFLKVYLESKDDEGDDDLKDVLPPLSEGQSLDLNYMEAVERFTKPKPRYTEPSLVKDLEELGIGRPSTYAPTITTIQKRNYAEKTSREGVARDYRYCRLEKGNVTSETRSETVGTEKMKLFPTDIGMVVNDFLVQNFSSIVDFSFTADLEAQFDKVALGDLGWDVVLDEFYQPFREMVVDTIENAERAVGERVLGEHPETGEVVKVRIGRYGPMAQIGETSEEEGAKKPRYSKLMEGQFLETITLEEALKLFELPRVLGTTQEGKEVKANIGRFGPYVQLDRTFASIPKDSGLDARSIQLDDALKLITAKLKADEERFIQVFEDGAIQVLKGRYGPYIKQGKKNFKIPKDADPAKLTLDEIKDIITNAPPPKRGRRKGK